MIIGPQGPRDRLHAVRTDAVVACDPTSLTPTEAGGLGGGPVLQSNRCRFVSLHR